MKAYIITIGDEILIGQTLNTNAGYIGERLTEIQVKVTKTSVVGDDEKAIIKEFKEASQSNDLVIVTGGLGPTHDDVTKKCVAQFFESKLVLNENVLANVKRLFEKRGRTVTKVNEDQALIPEIAKAITNERGTAPGMWIEKKNKIFIVMPGVPYEMQKMMEDYVIPKLQEKVKIKDNFASTVNLLVTGIPESTLFERLGNMDELLEGAKLAFLPNQFGVKLRLTALGEDEDKAKNKLTEIEQKIRSFVGRFIYGKENEKLEDVVAKLLIERSYTLSVAESCTGGLISNRLTNVSGSSEFLERGIVSYSNAAKVEVLKVEEDLIQKYGAVSIEVARQMAEGVRAISGTDIGLATTGIMGPTGGSVQKPVGLVYIGLCDDKMCTAKEFKFGDDRLLNKDRTSQAALDMLRRHLLGISND